MRGWKNKRGAEDIWNAITLLAGVIVGVILVMAVYRFTSTDRAKMVFFTRDGAMLTDAMLSAPGSFEIYYPESFSGRYAHYDGSEFIVSNGLNSTSISPYRSPFIPRGDIAMSNEPGALSTVFFLKFHDQISIQSSPTMQSIFELKITDELMSEDKTPNAETAE